jgi:phosphoglycerate dehydrogenase-like enzyme
MPKVVSTVPEQRFEKFGVAFPDGWVVAYVAAPYTEEELSAACRDADYLFVNSVHPVTARVIQENPQLKMIHVEGVAFNTVDLGAAKEAGIPVCNNRAVNNGAVAEHTIGLMLAGLRRIAAYNHEIIRDGFAACQSVARAEGQHELAGQHVGLVGFGAIGREVAKRLKNWGCRVSYYDAFRPTAEVEQELEVDFLELDELLRTCDIISLHVPVLPSTVGMINTRTLEIMKSNALLINTARGAVVEEPAVAAALHSGHRAGYAADVFETEPDLSASPLVSAPNTLLTPHIAWASREARQRLVNEVAENLRCWQNGTPRIRVN